MGTAKRLMEVSTAFTTKGRTPESGGSSGFLYALGLLLPAVPVKPFANAAGGYICHNRH